MHYSSRGRNLEEIRAIYIMDRYRNGDFAITTFRHDGKSVSVLGTIPEGELVSQLEYRLYGRWQNDPKFGRQFRLETFVVARPHSRTGTIKYLTQAGKGLGLGQATANKLWNTFAGDAVRILREQPEVAATAAAARGFDSEKAAAVAKRLGEMQAVEDCSIDLIELLDGRGGSKDTVRKAIAVWGNRATAILQRDPYKLMRFRGWGYLKCDAMYLDLGLPPGKLKRQAYAATYTVSSNTEGHIWHPVESAIKGVMARVGSVECEPEKALSLAKRGKILAERVDAAGNRWVADIRDAKNEEYIARHIAAAMDEQSAWPDVDSLPAGPSEHQLAELKKATAGVIGMLCGGPGTGKSFTSAALIRAIIDQYGIDEIAAASPTGKAAVRLTECMQEYGLPLKATTIHRMLGVAMAPESEGDEAGWGFNYNEHNPLPFKFVLVDEVSMADCFLMRSILAARARGTCILFVGDVNQLPPVGRGAPLRDFIAAGLPLGMLTEIHRNAGTVVRACEAIRYNKPIPTDTVLAPGETPPRNLKMIPAVKGNAQRVIVDLVRKVRDSGACDPVWDTQILVAVNARSPLGRKALNELLQNELNPSGERISGSPFRVGDKVICLRNTTFPYAKKEDGETLICNGEIGRVLEVHEKKTIIEFLNPSREVLVPRGTGNGKDKDGSGDKKSEDNGTGCDVDLAYAITCHKSQGSSAPIVIVALDEYPGASGEFGVCDRSWLYTAISRTEKLCFLVGKRETAMRICRRQVIHRRKTFLVEQIAEQREAMTPECQRQGQPQPQTEHADLFA